MKIVPFNGRFDNMKAFLAHIAEDEMVAGFVGMVIYDDEGTRFYKLATFDATCAEAAFASCILSDLAVNGELAENNQK